MHFFKLALSFLTIGGATYALIKIQKAPVWLVLASIVMALATLITALPHLPEAVDGITNAARKLDEILRQERSESEHAPTPEGVFMYAPAATECAALVMSQRGAWGASFGFGLTCSQRLKRARSRCAEIATSACSAYAFGLWVVGIHCRVRGPHGVRHYAFVGDGHSKTQAFTRAYRYASELRLRAHFCRPRVAVYAGGSSPYRYY